MKRALVGLLAFLGALGMAQKFSVEASAGYIYSGLGGQLAVVAEDLAPGLPLAVRLGLGFATSDALDDNYVIDEDGGTTWGDVKDASNLTEWGQNITLSLDVLFTLPAQGLPVSLAPYLGLRYNMFEGGSYNNSGWDKYSSNAFGFGGGIRAAYAVTPNLDVVADLGADYYLQSCITISSSVGSTTTTTCPGDFAYADLNAFVTQPDGFVFRVRLGAAYRF
jgi:hypothetical protein